MNKGADLVADAILNRESRTVIVGGKPYFIKPPTIRRIAGAGAALGDLSGETLGDILGMLRNTRQAACALSWFINGDDTLTDELCEGTLQEITEGIAVAFSLLDIGDFRKLSDLSRSVRRLIANPK